MKPSKSSQMLHKATKILKKIIAIRMENYWRRNFVGITEDEREEIMFEIDYMLLKRKRYKSMPTTTLST